MFWILLGIWFVHSIGSFLFELIRQGDVVFHGDTMGVHVSLLSIVIPLAVLALLLIGLVVKKDSQSEETHIPWHKANNKRALWLFALLPLQAVFFATGEPHNITDQIAVIISILQALLVWWVFVPVKKA